MNSGKAHINHPKYSYIRHTCNAIHRNRRRQNSRTKRLADYLLRQLPGTVRERNLATTSLLPLSEETIAQRENLVRQGDFSHPLLALAAEFASAEYIVIAAPFWDLSFPALLKLYIEHINILA